MNPSGRLESGYGSNSIDQMTLLYSIMDTQSHGQAGELAPETFVRTTEATGNINSYGAPTVAQTHVLKVLHGGQR